MVSVRSWTIGILALCFVSGAALAQDDAAAERIEEAVAQAKRLFDQGDAAKAWARIQPALREAPRALTDQPETLADLSAFAGLIALDLGRLDDAESAFRQSFDLARRAKGIDHESSVKASRNLAVVLAARGKHGEARPLLLEALNSTERRRGDGHPETGAVLLELGNVDRALGRYGDAEVALRRAVSIRERSGPPEDFAQALDALGLTLQRVWRLREAEGHHRRALAALDNRAAADPRHRGTYLNNLAVAVESQGRLGDAEDLFQSAIDLWAKAAGPDSLEHAVALNNLARVQYQLERYEETAALLRRATAAFEKQGRVDHADYCPTLSNLALAELELGLHARARELAARAVSACERRAGPSHPDLAEPLNTLGRIAMTQGDLTGAVDSFQRALTLAERAHGRDHPMTALALNNSAGALLAAGDERSAAVLLRRAVTGAERAGDGLEPLRATSLETLALAELRSGRIDAALDAVRTSSALTREWLTRAAPGKGSGSGSTWRDLRKRFAFHATLAAMAAAAATEATKLDDEAFTFAELARGSSAARAIGQMAARFAAGDSALSQLVRARQDVVERLQALDRQQVHILGQSDSDPATRSSVRAARLEGVQQLAEIDRRLVAEFSSFVDLSNPEPSGIAETRALLQPGEALVAYLARDDDVLIWFLDDRRFIMRRQPVEPDWLAELVRRVRTSVTPTQSGQVRPFDFAAAAELHRLLIEPIATAIAPVRHLLIVDDGPLRTIPFALLAPAPGANPEPDWLIRRHALTTLPSVSSLRALRRIALPSRAAEAFVGFGNPRFAGASTGTASRGRQRGWREGRVSQTALRALAPLPESADELRSIAHSLGGGNLYLGERATETEIKRAPLSRYRVLSFATHTLDLEAKDDASAEPGLALTPPKTPSDVDDGLLTVSEIARLKLDADTVILSACNTAGSDGSTGAESLSGLARAFIYAGARSLLVSHWPVETNATVGLTTGMFEALRANPQIGRAEALRRSMLKLAANPDSSHPIFWAPFVIVGEGGPARAR